MSTKYNLSVSQFRTNTPTVDASGVVKGVSCITAGEAKGHRWWIDEATLDSLVRVATGFAGGVKVKMEHSYGIDKIVGAIRNFRRDGKQVRADMALLKTHPVFPLLKEMIEKQATTFGLSISFSASLERIDGRDCCRIEDLYSVDLVDMPAANPGGLFSASNLPAAPQLTGVDRIAAAFRAETEKKRATLSAAPLLPTAPGSERTRLIAAFVAAYGQERLAQISQQNTPEAAFDLLERALYHDHVDVPGYDFSRAARFGERKKLFGISRFSATDRQARVNATLARLETFK